MALSKKDQAFYEEKLGWKAFGYLFAATTIIGAVMCPLILFAQDWSDGQTSKWSANMVWDLAVMGFMLGTVVAAVMYVAFKCLLALGWLPSRR
jgi:fumarate reductase subunit D